MRFAAARTSRSQQIAVVSEPPADTPPPSFRRSLPTSPSAGDFAIVPCRRDSMWMETGAPRSDCEVAGLRFYRVHAASNPLSRGRKSIPRTVPLTAHRHATIARRGSLDGDACAVVSKGESGRTRRAWSRLGNPIIVRNCARPVVSELVFIFARFLPRPATTRAVHPDRSVSDERRTHHYRPGFQTPGP